jgi:hypothetical protein
MQKEHNLFWDTLKRKEKYRSVSLIVAKILKKISEVNTQIQKREGGWAVAQVVEYLPSKCEALS